MAPTPAPTLKVNGRTYRLEFYPHDEKLLGETYGLPVGAGNGSIQAVGPRGARWGFRLEYRNDTERGVFFNLRGDTMPAPPRSKLLGLLGQASDDEKTAADIALENACMKDATECPSCEGVTGVNDCPLCGGNGYVEA